MLSAAANNNPEIRFSIDPDFHPCKVGVGKLPSPREIAIYFFTLASALTVWVFLWYYKITPHSTDWLWIYLGFQILTETYLVCRNHFPTGFRGGIKGGVYPWVKRAQRLVALAAIFMLTNGDLGTVIIIDLSFVAIEFLVNHTGGACYIGEFSRTWNGILRVDTETTKFLMIALIVLAVQNPFLEIVTSARWMLLLGMAVRSWMSIRRQKLQLKPGCPMDRRWAVVLAAWMLAIGLLFAALNIPELP